ncbi:MAG TPA: hypothetical protein PLD62_09710, partial [Candidatus Cloacimonadota bacterium]|nr:hypothetical protein [Candidatus Cloacimonadota bacterium]
QIVKLDELIKLIRTDLKKKPDKAVAFMNSWFDSNTKLYIEQLLQSELGSHQDQHKLFNMLIPEHKIEFFRQVVPYCREHDLKGFTAGSFMLGRFLCTPYPVKFWDSFSEDIIVWMLNEYVLFEKYMTVLDQVGEREVNRARKRILKDGLDNINLKLNNAKTFTSLKLCER